MKITMYGVLNISNAVVLFVFCISEIYGVFVLNRKGGKMYMRPITLNRKDGMCPFMGQEKAGACTRECDPQNGDNDCPEELKCCFTGCEHVCVHPVEPIDKVGFCPTIPQNLQCNGNSISTCKRDIDCPGTTKKCCSDGCSNKCMEPAVCKNKKKWRGTIHVERKNHTYTCQNCKCDDVMNKGDSFVKEACRQNMANIRIGCCFFCEIMGFVPITPINLTS